MRISLFNEIENFLLLNGALKVGVATPETLADGLPSVDITYPLKTAKSAICFALPLDKKKFAFFYKKNYQMEGLTTKLIILKQTLKPSC
ncbi:MAG: hypothetical protein ACTSU4_13465 [Promethearchaeota archaeon]